MATARAATVEIDPRYAVDELAAAVSAARLERTVRDLAAMGSRMPGLPGNAAAARYVADALKRAGVADVAFEPFDVVVPVPTNGGTGAHLDLSTGERIAIHPLWPNLIRTCQTPPAGVSGPLIDAGMGALSAYNGHETLGSIVLLEFNSGRAWYDARMLGASAILFAEPDLTIRGEATEKFSELPLNVPRFYVRRADVERIRAGLRSGTVSGTIHCDVRMKSTTTWNIVGRLSRKAPAEAGAVDEKALEAQTVVLGAYYDSVSAVPDLAPGADSAAGVAVLIELARVLAKHPPARDVIFLATSAHFQAMAGMREFIASRIPKAGESAAFRAFIGLDLSTHGRGVGTFWKGSFYGISEAHTYKFSDIGMACGSLGKAAAQALGVAPELSVRDTVNTGAERHWSTFLPLALCLEGEAATLAGYSGLTLASIEDARPYLDTPFDTPERVDFANLALQARAICATVPNLLADVSAPGLFTADPGNGFALVHGGVFEFGRSISFLPQDKVPGAIAAWLKQPKSVGGVRRTVLDEVDEKSQYRFAGMVNQSHRGGGDELGAFHCDPETGDIDYAADYGPTGVKALGFDNFAVAANDAGKDIVVFQCRPLEIYDIFDPASFSHLSQVKVLDRQTNATPFDWGRIVPSFQSFEPAALVFGKPDKHLIVTLRPGGLYARMLVLNGTEDNPLGMGMQMGQDRAVFFGAYSAVKDLWRLDDTRINKFSAWGVGDKRALQLHAETATLIAEAEKARDSGRVDVFIATSRKALSIENRVYPKVEGTARDVVNGVLFYLVLLVPFSYLAERLLVAARTLKWQAVWTFAIFALVFLTLVCVHPAFRVTTTPVVVLLAFILAGMAVLVTLLVIRHFDQLMEDFRYKKSGQHTADVARLSTAGSAFALGVANMRRRTLRTSLTSITLILLTFTVLSFTAVTTSQTVRAIRQSYPPAYDGLLLRTPNLGAFAENTYVALRNEIDPQYAMAPRAWLLSVGSGNESVVPIWYGDQRYQATALLGCHADEPKLTPVLQTLVGPRSRWFDGSEADLLTCIVPTNLAKRFGIRESDIGTATVSINGYQLQVIGIFDETAMDAIKDLDDEQLMPVDEIREANLRKSGESTKEEASTDPSQLQTRIRIPSQSVVLVPYDLCLRCGGPLRSISVKFGAGDVARQAQDDMVYRLDLSSLSGYEGQVHYRTSIAAAKVSGLEGSLVPMLIAALIVLNTMLGSVYERIKEISIYSSLGLSPAHVGFLFVAESAVYSVLGAMIGYVLGQAAAKIVVSNPEWSRYLSLNYSSMAAVGSTLIIMAVVFLSTLYPARRAADLAAPGVERRWRLPQPEGDSLRVRLPFTVARAEAAGCFLYVGEYLDAHSDYTLGEFSTDGCAYVPPDDGGVGHRLVFTAWLSPYDLGVSERVVLETVETPEEEVLGIDALVFRVSGDEGAWLRTTRSFVYLLRRQFLLWRVLGPELKASYHEQAAAAAMSAGGAEHVAASGQGGE